MINAYLVDDLYKVVAPSPPFNEFNVPNAPVVTAIKGYIEWKTRIVKDLSGSDVVSNMRVLLKYNSDLGHEDKLRIYDDSQGKSIDWPILNMDRAKDFSPTAIWVSL